MITMPISNISLFALLELIGSSKLCWSILHVWVISKHESGINILELEDGANTSFGCQLNWIELLTLARQLDQVIECTIVGVNVSENLPRRDAPLEELKESCEIVIEAVDSTFWEIFVKDEIPLRNASLIFIFFPLCFASKMRPPIL